MSEASLLDKVLTGTFASSAFIPLEINWAIPRSLDPFLQKNSSHVVCQVPFILVYKP